MFKLWTNGEDGVVESSSLTGGRSLEKKIEKEMNSVEEKEFILISEFLFIY